MGGVIKAIIFEADILEAITKTYVLLLYTLSLHQSEFMSLSNAISNNWLVRKKETKRKEKKTYMFVSSHRHAAIYLPVAPFQPSLSSPRHSLDHLDARHHT